MIRVVSSIRRQLLCWLIIPIATLLVVDAVIAQLFALDMANDAYDDTLVESAEAVASRFRIADGRLVVDMPTAARAIFKYSGQDQCYFQVLDSKRSLVFGDPEIPLPPKVTANVPQIRSAMVGKDRVRVAAISKPTALGDFIIQVAETLQTRQTMVNRILASVIAPQLTLVLLTILAIWFAIQRGLIPLADLQAEISRRNPTDLSRLNESTAPKELKPIVSSINSLLNRISQDREARKRFTANATHHLRTPLAGLKVQIQLLLRDDLPPALRNSIEQISHSVERPIKLVRQLLTLARVDPAVVQPVPLTGKDLERIVRLAIEEVIAQAVEKSLDLGLQSELDNCTFMGDPESLQELVSNLVENAVLYSPSGGKVTVTLAHNDAAVLILVEDQGPGIPSEHRERVFERFYRVLGTGVAGTGLGLAIVREIADFHGALIEINSGANGVGTAITVGIPRAPEDSSHRLIPAALNTASS